MASVKKAILFSVGEKYIVFFIQFASSVVLARILSPHEIGIFSIGSLILSFSHALRDLGISNYILQERELTQDRLRTAATITLAMSWLLAIVALGVSGPIAGFYGEDGIGEVLVVLSFNFFILPFGSVSVALLKRNMQFDKLIRINLTAAAVHALVAIGLCSYGVGFIGLAWAGVAGTVVTVVMTLLIGRREVSFRPTLSEWRRVLSTGGRFSASALLGELGLGAPEMIAGKTMTIEAAGLLARAQGVVNLAYRSLMEGLLPVLMPFFSQSHRAGEDVAGSFIKSIRYLSAVSFPLFGCLTVAMDAIVQLLYGEQWNAAVGPARILCVGMAVLSIGHTAGAVVSGMGHAKYALRFNLVGQPIKAVLVLLGSFYSLEHVAGGVAIGDALITAYTLVVLCRLLDLDGQHILSALGSSLFVALCAASACLAFKMSFAGFGALTSVVGCMIASLLGWIVGLLMCRHPLGGEIGSIIRRLARS